MAREALNFENRLRENFGIVHFLGIWRVVGSILKPQTHFAKCLEKAENVQTPTYDLSNSNNITNPFGASVWPKLQIFDVPAKTGIPNAFCETFRKNRKFFKPQRMTYQNLSNNITKPFGASVWPKSQIFDVPAKIGIPNAFCEMFRKIENFSNPNIWPIKIHQIT